jgi:hypothetical protein
VRRLNQLWLLAWLLALAACQVEPPDQTLIPVVIERGTPTPSITPSLTPIWFPATETPTPVPSLTLRPTEDMRPGLQSGTFSDDFSKGGWQTYKNEAGQAAFGKNELTLAISLEKGFLSSLRASPLPGDSYLEITATPNLCQNADIFGLYLRAASPGDGYRLLVNCAGMLRLERLKNRELVVLQDWQPGLGIIPGGMLPMRLGVWANAKELRFFVNDQYEFSTRDPVWTEGMVGVYARAASDSPLTVSFSDLVVHRLDPARIPTLTPQPTATP